MSKKSAMSKGYRKTVKKKPFLSKKEIIALVVIIAAIVLAVVLFNLFYDDGFLGAKQVKPGDVVCYAGSNMRTRYAKIAEINDLEGFTREDQGNENNALVTYNFTPDAETDHIKAVTVTGSFVPASDLADTTISYMTGSMTDESSIQVSDKMEAEVQGYPAYIFSYSSDYYDETLEAEADEVEAAEGEAVDAEAAETEAVNAEAAETEAAEGEAVDAEAAETEETEPASNVYSQNLSCYVQFDDTHTLCLHVYRSGEDESFYLADDQVVDYVMNYTSAFTMLQPEAK